MSDNSDIRENSIYDYDPKLLEILLIDRTRSNEKKARSEKQPRKRLEMFEKLKKLKRM
jgi:hypothetical protein